jgi:hypothetical protein
MLHITSEIHTVAMFFIDGLEIILNTEFVGTFMIFIHTKFHMPISDGSLDTAVNPKAKYRFHSLHPPFSCLTFYRRTEKSYEKLDVSFHGSIIIHNFRGLY